MLCSWCGSLCVTGTETYAVSLCLYTDSFWRCETWPTSLYNKALPCKTTHWHWPGTWLWDEWPETEIKSSRFFLNERRWGMCWKWCEKALGYPGMARNSPSLSGSSGERQKRLRRKEYISPKDLAFSVTTQKEAQRKTRWESGRCGRGIWDSGWTQQKQTFPQYHKAYSMFS